MIIKSTAGKIDAVIGRFEGPILAFMEKEEGDYAQRSLKNVLYNVKSSKHYSESITGMTGIGDMVATDGPVPYDEFEEGFAKTFIHQVFKKGIEIKRETMDDALLLNMENQAGQLMDAANRTKEKFVHAPFWYATSPTFTLAGKTFQNVGADGLTLGHDSHPSHSGKGVTQSNLTTNTLTEANLKTAEEMMINFKIDNGEPGNFVPDTLFVPYKLRHEAYKLVESESTVTNNSGGNSGIANPYKNSYRVIVSKWLDMIDDDQWFLIDSKYMKKCLYWLNRVELEIESKKDFNTDNWLIKAYERYSLGFTDWRWVVVNKPA